MINPALASVLVSASGPALALLLALAALAVVAAVLARCASALALPLAGFYQAKSQLPHQQALARARARALALAPLVLAAAAVVAEAAVVAPFYELSFPDLSHLWGYHLRRLQY